MTQVRWEEEEESKQGREARGRNDSRQQDTHVHSMKTSYCHSSLLQSALQKPLALLYYIFEEKWGSSETATVL